MNPVQQWQPWCKDQFQTLMGTRPVLFSICKQVFISRLGCSVDAQVKMRRDLLWWAKCSVHRFIIRLRLPLYTCCEKRFPSSSWSQDCDTSSSGGSNGDIQVSLYTARLPSYPARWDSCQPAHLHKEEGNMDGNTFMGMGSSSDCLCILRLPNSCSEKTTNVLSSFRFLLNSMESSLMSLDVLFISLEKRGSRALENEQVRKMKLLKETETIWLHNKTLELWLHEWSCLLIQFQLHSNSNNTKQCLSYLISSCSTLKYICIVYGQI